MGYLQSVTPKNYVFLLGMFVTASALYLFAFVKAAEYLKLPFYPSYASFTFPFVISATNSIAYLINLCNHPSFGKKRYPPDLIPRIPF